MLLFPPLLVMLCLQAPQVAPAALGRQIADLEKAGNWPGLVDLMETLTPQQQMLHGYVWLAALNRTGRWARLVTVAEAMLAGGKHPADPVHFYPRYLKGKALVELGRNSEALAAFRQNGSYGEISSYVAACTAASNAADWRALQECAEALLVKKPGEGSFLAFRGEALAKQGRFQEAEPVLQEAVQLAPRAAMAWADLSCCRNERGAYQEAFTAAAAALALDPAHLEGLCNRGRASMGLKRYREGRNDYAAALALRPADPLLVRNLKANITMADTYLAYQKTKVAPRSTTRP